MANMIMINIQNIFDTEIFFTELDSSCVQHVSSCGLSRILAALFVILQDHDDESGQEMFQGI